MSNDDRRSHWNSIYTTKNEDEVSWFEQSPDLSLELLREAGLRTDMAVVDIGGGASVAFHLIRFFLTLCG